MSRFKKILLLVGRDLDSISRTIKLAASHQAQLTICQDLKTAIPELERKTSSSFDFAQLAAEKLRNDLRERVNSCEAVSEDVNTQIFTKDLLEELRGFIWRERPDVIVLPHSEFAIFRSLLRKIIGDNPIPLLLAKDDLPISNLKILVVVGQLNGVVESTIRYCKTLNMIGKHEFYFLNPLEGIGERAFEGRREIAIRAFRSSAAQDVATSTTALQTMLTQHDFNSGEIIVHNGSKTKLISKYVNEKSIDLVVLNPADLEKSIWPRLEIPLERIIRAAGCSVLITASPNYVD